MPLPALLTGGRCRPQRSWGSNSLPPYQMGALLERFRSDQWPAQPLLAYFGVGAASATPRDWASTRSAPHRREVLPAPGVAAHYPHTKREKATRPGVACQCLHAHEHARTSGRLCSRCAWHRGLLFSAVTWPLHAILDLPALGCSSRAQEAPSLNRGMPHKVSSAGRQRSPESQRPLPRRALPAPAASRRAMH